MSKSAADKVVQSLYASHFKKVVSYLRRRVYDEEDAKELANEAFARVLRIERKNAIEEPGYYLLRVAANLAIEHREKQKKSVVDAVEELPEQDDTSEMRSLDDDIDVQQRIAQLNHLLKQLPPKVQAAVILHRRDGYTYDEIAAQLGVSKSMIKKYLRRGLTHVQTAMAPGLSDVATSGKEAVSDD